MIEDLVAADKIDLVQLASTYAAFVDERNWDGLPLLFTPDALLVTPDPPTSLDPVLESRGPEAIVATVRAVSGFARTVHHLTGSVWTPDPVGGVFGRTTAVAHHVEHGEQPRSWVWHLIYRDRCVRVDHGWAFAHRELTIAMIEARPVARVLPFGGSTP